MKVTRKDVAEHAGVSEATVSYVVNDGPRGVAPKTRAKVEKAIAELGYYPSAIARSLKIQQTNSVGVLLPALNDMFFSQFAYSVEKELYNHGYHPLFCNIENDSAKEDFYVDMLLRQHIDAVVIVPNIPAQSSLKNISKLLKHDVPVVVVERFLPDAKTNQVIVDNFGGAYAGAEYLHSQGHRHVGVIASKSDHKPDAFAPGHERIKGIQSAFADKKSNECLVIQYEDSLTGIDLGYQGTQNLLKRAPHLTALFALNDQIAVGVYHALHDLGLRIPDDISVLGFDDIPIASHIIPKLSTIAQPIQQIGIKATELLLKRLNQSSTKVETITLKTKLIMRDSIASL